MKDSSLKRVSGYGVAVAAVLGTSSAEATIHFVDITPDATGTSVNTNVNAQLLSFNLAGDVSTNGISVANEQFFFPHKYNSTGPSTHSSKLQMGTTNGVAAFSTTHLTYGTTIGPGQTVDPTTQGTAILLGAVKNGWTPGLQGYLALRFDNNGVANYGWADVTTVNVNTIVLSAFAYDDAGNPVAAGSVEPVPEPSQIALFALGAAGVAAYRRRKSIPVTK
jgi:hypothetical protein